MKGLWLFFSQKQRFYSKKHKKTIFKKYLIIKSIFFDIKYSTRQQILLELCFTSKKEIHPENT